MFEAFQRQFWDISQRRCSFFHLSYYYEVRKCLLLGYMMMISKAGINVFLEEIA